LLAMFAHMEGGDEKMELKIKWKKQFPLE